MVRGVKFVVALLVVVYACISLALMHPTDYFYRILRIAPGLGVNQTGVFQVCGQ
jgi:hypothetical protein